MIDYKYTDDMDLDLSSGDLQYVESSQQHINSLLLANKGDIRHSPSTGVGIVNYINDESGESLSEIRKELIADGMRVDSIQLTTKGLKIEAQYV
ncbi:MAG: hypothetical protein K2Q03_03555 [Sphingobacteriaceae bacterium]|nr:hypothetical protein [Sphingobacteriaceae bacterium]